MNKFNIDAIILFVFLLSCLAFSSVNSSVTCSPSGGTLTCDIATVNKTLIHEIIASSFVAGITKLEIIVSTAGAGVTLNISLPDNITELRIVNIAAAEIFVETYTVNSGVVKIDWSDDRITIEQINFFSFFPNLQDIFVERLGSVFHPIFTQNKELTQISVDSTQIEDVSSRVINHTIFGGLDKLEYLKWSESGITEIKAGSFKGVSKLIELTLSNNNIQKLESCAFEGLGMLTSLSLYSDMIRSVHPNAFLGLNNLRNMEIGENPSMPLSAITVLKNLQKLYVKKIDSMRIFPEIIQQLNALTYLSLASVQFNCTCDTEWISKLSSFGITVSSFGSTCVNDSRKVTDASLYTLCGTRSYQCFNKSIECVGENWNRVDTVDGCECVYPEYTYNVSEICNDINECEDSAICQGNCTNTPGSYKCSCLEGYYNANDTLCSDIDECLLFNGNCSHFCSNAIGSYECSCLHGYLKNASTDCYLPDPCSTNNGGCHHTCTDGIYGYACSCLEGFQVSSSNSSHCDSDLITGTGELNANSKAPALFVLLFVCFLFLVTIILLFIIIMFVFLYFRIQIQKLKSTPTSNKLSLAEMDGNKQRKATVIENPNSDSVPNN